MRVRADRTKETEALKGIRLLLKRIEEDEEAGRTQDILNEWELDFLQSLRTRKTLSEKQAAKVLELCEKMDDHVSKHRRDSQQGYD